MNYTGPLLADLINATAKTVGIFTPSELANFVNNYRFIGSTSRGPGVAGGDAVAFQNVNTGTIVIGVAGVNDHDIAYEELPQTALQTILTGANGYMYSDVTP